MDTNHIRRLFHLGRSHKGVSACGEEIAPTATLRKRTLATRLDHSGLCFSGGCDLAFLKQCLHEGRCSADRCIIALTCPTIPCFKAMGDLQGKEEKGRWVCRTKSYM